MLIYRASMRGGHVGERESTRPDLKGLLLIGSTSLVAILAGSLLIILV
jgi:hypothetical protein